MEVERSSIQREIDLVFKEGPKPVHYTWNAVLHIGKDYNLPIMKVISVDIEEDYENNIAEAFFVRFLIPGGKYIKRIYPNQNNLEITLIRSPIFEADTANNQKVGIYSERFSVALCDTGNPQFTAQTSVVYDETALDRTVLLEVDFQLINKSFEQLRAIQVGGVFRDCTVEDVLKGVLTKESQTINVDAIKKPKGINMVPASNTAVKTQVVLPHGLSLVALPAYMQKYFGVYSAGMGYFFKNGYWYIYPCYDTKRVSESLKSVKIFILPKQKYPTLNRTYRENGNNTVILVTGEASFQSDSEQQQLNHGVGVRFANADQMMDGFIQTEENKALASRGKNVTEVAFTERPNKKNYTPVDPEVITANPYTRYSAMARRMGGVFAVVWENSLPGKIEPGMMVEVVFIDTNGLLKQATGIILKAHHSVQMYAPGIVEARYVMTTALFIYVNL